MKVKELISYIKMKFFRKKPVKIFISYDTSVNDFSVCQFWERTEDGGIRLIDQIVKPPNGKLVPPMVDEDGFTMMCSFCGAGSLTHNGKLSLDMHENICVKCEAKNHNLIINRRRRLNLTFNSDQYTIY